MSKYSKYMRDCNREDFITGATKAEVEKFNRKSIIKRIGRFLDNVLFSRLMPAVIVGCIILFAILVESGVWNLVLSAKPQ